MSNKKNYRRYNSFSKTIKGFFLLTGLLICFLVLSACSKQVLTAPTIEINLMTRTVSWDLIENTSGYDVSINDEIHHVASFIQQEIEEEDSDGNVIMIEKKDASGKVVLKEKLDEEGNIVRDNNGLPVWEPVLVPKLITVTVKNPFPNSYSLANLSPNEYLIKVRAVTHDSNYYKDSPWSEPKAYTVPPATGLVYKLINNDTEYEIVGRGSSSSAVNIEDYKDGRPVTRIAENVFQGSNSLRSIVIGKNVKSIGENAFFNCGVLTSVTFAEDSQLLSIGDHAFNRCRNLTSIIIPDSLTTIGNSAFINCRGLENVTFGQESKLTLIGDNAFSGCESIVQFTIPTGVTSIGNAAFSSCTSIAEIIIPSSVRFMGEQAFRLNTNLANVIIRDGLSNIAYGGFWDCINLTNVSISNSVTSIGDGAFYGCSKLASIVIPESVTSIAISAFMRTAIWNNTPANQIVYADRWAVGFLGFSEEDIEDEKTTIAFRPDTVGIANSTFYGIEALTDITDWGNIRIIGQNAFQYCNNLRSVTFGNTLKTIGANAFCYSKSLTVIDFEENSQLLSIENGAFIGCEMLTEATVPPSVTRVGYQAFYNTAIWRNAATPSIVYVSDWVVDVKKSDSAYLPSVRSGTVGICDFAFYQASVPPTMNLPEGLNYIGIGAFRESWIVNVTIPNSIISLGASAFYGCEGLSSVTLEEGITNIDSYTFYKTPLNNIRIPNSVTAIGAYAFFESAVAAITFGEDSELENIGNYAFYGVKRLGTIKIPDSVISIGNHSFRRSLIKTVEFGENSRLESIGNFAFRDCQQLTSIDLPDSLLTIGDYAFRDCELLESIVIPNKVISIGYETFRACTSLVNVEFGSKVTSIGEYAFFGCTSLRAMTIPSSITNIASHAFRNTRMISIIITSDLVSMGSHVFNGSNRLTIYTEVGNRPGSWASNWNSSNRPVIWGCTLSSDKQRIVSFTKSTESVLNPNAINGILWPYREGFAFGWSLTQNGAPNYTAAEVNSVPNGTLLYACWIPLELSTYTFVTNGGIEIYDIEEYMLFVAPLTTRSAWNYSYEFVAWYDNESLEGTPVVFPYYSLDGTKTTLYAKWEKTPSDGLTTATAYELMLDTATTVSITLEQDFVWFSFVAEATGTYTIKSIGNLDTMAGVTADGANWLMIDDNSGEDFNFSMTLQLEEGKTYCFAILTSQDEEGRFPIGETIIIIQKDE